MKHLIIIGARGAGRETYDRTSFSIGYGLEFDVKGFLDDNPNALEGKPGYPSILSSVEDYKIQPNDVFICALGDPQYRQIYAQKIIDKGGEFITLIDKTAIIGQNAVLGKGCIIKNHVTISTDVHIGDFVYIQPYCDVGHDAVVGNYCHLNTYSFMGGYSQLEDYAVLQTHATLLPHKRVGVHAVVGAGSVAIRNVKANTTVVGVPAIRLKF